MNRSIDFVMGSAPLRVLFVERGKRGDFQRYFFPSGYRQSHWFEMGNE
ncbi:hypothetical protein [Flagellimonas sediminis]|uniref:Uncharacterized protein n=1 Tax=Flagellimonas sediminis TaxID=2696468 RepID=A0A6I5L4T1_9FLAO|nr:hypothetical protein [Allomuricauda sediminis]NDV44691.1 hypothetical protein [Allomuricauda sediminis]